MDNAKKAHTLNQQSTAITDILTREILLDRYVHKNESLQDIADAYNCTRQMIHHLMKKYNIVTRKRSQARLLAIKHNKFKKFTHDEINEDFFSSWSAEMAWVLGVIFTDGCLHESTPTGRRITIDSMDLDLLEKIKKLLNSSREIGTRKQSYDETKEIYFFNFYREKMRQDLKLLGLTSRKSLTMTFPSMPPSFVRHFIRGCWDGDGSAFLTKTGCGIRASYVSGSEMFIKSLAGELFKFGIGKAHLHYLTDDIHSMKVNYPDGLYPLTIHKRKRTGNYSYEIKVDGSENIKRLFIYLYDGVEPNMYLSRKYEIFKKIIIRST